MERELGSVGVSEGEKRTGYGVGVSASLRQICKHVTHGQPHWLHVTSPPLVSPGDPCCLCPLLPGLYYIYALILQSSSCQSLESLCLPFPFWNVIHPLRLSTNATSSMKPFLISSLSLHPYQFHCLHPHCVLFVLLL